MWLATGALKDILNGTYLYTYWILCKFPVFCTLDNINDPIWIKQKSGKHENGY